GKRRRLRLRSKRLRAGEEERSRSLPRASAFGKADGRGRLPHRAHEFPRRPHLRHAASDEVLPGALAAERAYGAVLRLQHALSRGPSRIAGAGGGGGDAAGGIEAGVNQELPMTERNKFSPFPIGALLGAISGGVFATSSLVLVVFACSSVTPNSYEDLV